jgi:hypothetical protein
MPGLAQNSDVIYRFGQKSSATTSFGQSEEATDFEPFMMSSANELRFIALNLKFITK